jgi:cobalamin synthase
MRRLGPLYGGAVALVHSTPWRWPSTITDEHRSPAWIVALGAPIGVVAWLVAALAHGAGIPPQIAAVAGIAMLTVASAAIVERGLAARIEQWQGHGRAGAGVPTVVALVFVTLVRAASLAFVAPSHWLVVLIAAAMVGRWAAVFLQSLGDPIAPDDDTGRSLVATPAPAWLIGALSVAAAAVCILALGKAGIVAVALTAAITFGLGIDAQRRDHGLAAPVVATAAAIGELAVLLIATLG